MSGRGRVYWVVSKDGTSFTNRVFPDARNDSAYAARPRRRDDRMKRPRVHHAARWRGGVAARGARAAAGDAGGRISP